MKWLYLAVNFGTVIVPFIFSFHPKLLFFKNFSSFLKAAIFAAVIFVAWDIAFTKAGVWGFNPDYVSGIYLFNLPLEEVLFFFCIPFSCLFTYHCLTLFYKMEWERSTVSKFIAVLCAILLLTGILHVHQLYTSVTFISLSVFLLFLQFYLKVDWLGKLLNVYPVLLIPFFIVNGILTGTGLAQPVVWYNDAHNLGIRLLTIPMEDVFYGFELITLNLLFYKYIQRKEAA
jgi:lycopene cyclase domain-containing protein